MKKFICLLGLCLLLFTGCSSNEEKKAYKITSDEQLVQVLEQYQFDKSRVDLEAVTEYLQESEILSNKGAISPIRGFYIGVLKENPQAFRELSKNVSSIPLEKIFKTSKEFSQDMEMILSGEQRYYPESAEFLDSLWGYYYATGDDRVIKMVCKIKDHDIDPVIRATASWSLKSHKEKYPDKIKGCN